MSNKKGFTLVELMGVMAILGVLVTLVTWTVTRFIIKAEESARKEAESNLKDAAVSYMIENDYYLKTCDISQKEQCERKTFTVQDLINEKLFKDDANKCDKNGSIIVYMDLSSTYIVEFASADICNK